MAIPILTKDDAGNVVAQDAFTEPLPAPAPAIPAPAPAAISPGDTVSTVGGTAYVAKVGTNVLPVLPAPALVNVQPTSDFADTPDVDRSTFAQAPGVTRGVTIPEAKAAGDSPDVTTVLFKNTAPPTPVFTKDAHPTPKPSDVASSLNALWLPDDEQNGGTHVDRQADTFNANYQLGRKGSVVLWDMDDGTRVLVDYGQAPPAVLAKGLTGVVNISDYTNPIPKAMLDAPGAPAVPGTNETSMTPYLVIAGIALAGFFLLKGAS